MPADLTSAKIAKSGSYFDDVTRDPRPYGIENTTDKVRRPGAVRRKRDAVCTECIVGIPYTGPATEIRKISLYASIMEEVKFRITASEGLNIGKVNIHVALIHEMSFLQIRMICELIALGCLIAHGDIEETTSLRKEWSADRIIDKLSILHADFYPVPIESVITAGKVFSRIDGFSKRRSTRALWQVRRYVAPRKPEEDFGPKVQRA